jgi:hypothetical protein
MNDILAAKIRALASFAPSFAPFAFSFFVLISAPHRPSSSA